MTRRSAAVTCPLSDHTNPTPSSSSLTLDSFPLSLSLSLHLSSVCSRLADDFATQFESGGLGQRDVEPLSKGRRKDVKEKRLERSKRERERERERNLCEHEAYATSGRRHVSS